VLDVEDVVAAGLYAINAPSHVGIHEILIEPRRQALW
jgi:NADP-dependent 3-hydroxy acid dehydrogenase YdfG